MRTEIFADTKAGRAIEVTFYEYDCDGEISELGGPVRTPNAEHFCGVIFHSERKDYYEVRDMDALIDDIRGWEVIEYCDPRERWDDGELEEYAEEYGYYRKVEIKEIDIREVDVDEEMLSIFS